MLTPVARVCVAVASLSSRDTYNARVSIPGLEAFHFGFVVRDLDAVTGRYGRMLGITRWRNAEFDMSVMPWVAQPSDARLRIAISHAARRDVRSFRCCRGGRCTASFWSSTVKAYSAHRLLVPDVRDAVTAAVAEGARVVCAFLQRSGTRGRSVDAEQHRDGSGAGRRPRADGVRRPGHRHPAVRVLWTCQSNGAARMAGGRVPERSPLSSAQWPNRSESKATSSP